MKVTKPETGEVRFNCLVSGSCFMNNGGMVFIKTEPYMIDGKAKYNAVVLETGALRLFSAQSDVIPYAAKVVPCQ